MGLSLRLGVARSRRRKATRLSLLVALCALFLAAPGAFALDQMVDAVATDTTVADAPIADATADVVEAAAAPVEPVAIVDPPPPPPPPAEPAPAPAPEAPAAVEPPPAPPTAPEAPAAPVDPVVEGVAAAPIVAPSEPAPPPPSAPQEATIRTAPAPQEGEPVRTNDEPAFSSTATTLAVASPDDVPPPRAEPGVMDSKATTPIAAEAAASSSRVSPQPDSPLIVPMVQAPFATSELVTTGLPVPYASPVAAEHETAAGYDAAATGAAKASEVESDLVFRGFVPAGGLSDHSAGLLAMLMGLLPMGLPDGKFSMSAQTQLGWLVMGVLLVVIPFFASPIRDRRRRGPRGFATLALRPG